MIPGLLGIPELNKLARTPGLPSTWHDVRCDRTGEVLYWRREHTGYEVHPVGAMGRDHQVTRYQVEIEGQEIGQPHDTLSHAIVAARDHMHEHGNFPGSLTAQEATR